MGKVRPAGCMRPSDSFCAAADTSKRDSMCGHLKSPETLEYSNFLCIYLYSHQVQPQHKNKAYTLLYKLSNYKIKAL